MPSMYVLYNNVTRDSKKIINKNSFDEILYNSKHVQCTSLVLVSHLIDSCTCFLRLVIYLINTDNGSLIAALIHYCVYHVIEI